jgi:hypothetical protein
MQPLVNLLLEAFVVVGAVKVLRMCEPVPTQTVFTFIAVAAFLCTFGTIQEPTFMPTLPWYGPAVMGLITLYMAAECEHDMRVKPHKWALLRPPTAMQRPEHARTEAQKQ